MSDATIAALLSEHWKLLRLFRRNIDDLPSNKQRKTQAQWQFADGRLTSLLSELAFRLVEYEGKEYSANLPVIVVNADDFDSNEGLVIERTLEPTVLHYGRVIQMGKVLVEKGGDSSESGN